jgi:hypothetical protein
MLVVAAAEFPAVEDCADLKQEGSYITGSRAANDT